MLYAKFNIILALLTALLACGCVETRTVSHSPTGMDPIPTRVEYAIPPQQQKQDEGFHPFKWIGDLFQDDGPQPMQINSQGQTVKVPPGYTGQTLFTDKEGKNYKLNFQNGTLVGVDPLTTPGSPGPTANKPPAPTQ